MSPTSQFVDHSDHQARPSVGKGSRRGCSKAQACLHRILRIIASSSKGPSPSLQSSSGGLGIDLNLRFCSASFGEEEEEEDEEGGEGNVGLVDESGSFSSSSVAAPEVGKGPKGDTVLEKSAEVDCEAGEQAEETNCERVVVGGDGDRGKAEEEGGEEENGDADSGSEITNVQVQSFEKSDEDRASEMRRSNSDGFLGLLLEAAKLVSGHGDGDGDGDEDGETEPSERLGQRRELHESPRTKADAAEAPIKTELPGSKKKQQIPEEAFGEPEADASPPPPQPPSSPPVVRTKRGRNQVLPYRFRDSVLEPWARLSRSNPVPTKRRVGVKP